MTGSKYQTKSGTASHLSRRRLPAVGLATKCLERTGKRHIPSPRRLYPVRFPQSSCRIPLPDCQNTSSRFGSLVNQPRARLEGTHATAKQGLEALEAEVHTAIILHGKEDAAFAPFMMAPPSGTSNLTTGERLQPSRASTDGRNLRSRTRKYALPTRSQLSFRARSLRINVSRRCRVLRIRRQ